MRKTLTKWRITRFGYFQELENVSNPIFSELQYFPLSVLAKMCIPAFNTPNLRFYSLMARGWVQNKNPHYAGPKSELDGSSQAAADAQKCCFLT